MRQQVVCDASAVIAVLLDAGLDGQWSTDALTGVDLAAPRLLRFEAANLAHRAWQLRRNLTPYDASYVALAELLDTTLVTLDRGIDRAPGLRCTVATP